MNKEIGGKWLKFYERGEGHCSTMATRVICHDV